MKMHITDGIRCKLIAVFLQFPAVATKEDKIIGIMVTVSKALGTLCNSIINLCAVM